MVLSRVVVTRQLIAGHLSNKVWNHGVATRRTDCWERDLSEGTVTLVGVAAAPAKGCASSWNTAGNRYARRSLARAIEREAVA